MQSLPITGRIELIVGPMFSGKTEELMRLLKTFHHGKKRIVVINYDKNNRYDNVCSNGIVSHDQNYLPSKTIPCPAFSCSRLEQVANEEKIKSSQVIGVDEGQFISDLSEVCEMWANQGKIVIISALDGSFEKKPFQPIIDIMGRCEKMIKLASKCEICGEDAAFTRRLTDATELELIGGKEDYSPRCRTCFKKNQENNENASLKNSNNSLKNLTNLFNSTTPNSSMESDIFDS